MSSIGYENGALVVRTPYNAGLVAELKAVVPAQDRQWDKVAKAWKVAPQHGTVIVDLIARYCSELVCLPTLTSKVADVRETRILEVRYIGTTKDRGDGSPTAFGLINGEWSAIFTEQALRDWFSDEARPGREVTLYATLGIAMQVSAEEVKKSYRRLARQWHPDVCKEPDAKEQFQAIQHAYEVLSDPLKRERYNAGLALAGSVHEPISRRATWSMAAGVVDGYRSPLRCGYLICEGVERLGRFVVDRITAWEDITNRHGQTLVTSWPMGAKAPSENWV